MNDYWKPAFACCLIALSLNSALRWKLPLTHGTLVGLSESVLGRCSAGIVTALEPRAAEGDLGEELKSRIAKVVLQHRTREFDAECRAAARRFWEPIMSGAEPWIIRGEG